jgi:hypothetical protein
MGEEVSILGGIVPTFPLRQEQTSHRFSQTMPGRVVIQYLPLLCGKSIRNVAVLQFESRPAVGGTCRLEEAASNPPGGRRAEDGGGKIDEEWISREAHDDVSVVKVPLSHARPVNGVEEIKEPCKEICRDAAPA